MSKPTKLPRWAGDPPAGPPTTITEPTELEKDEGWQPGKPQREYMNWWQELTYRWVEWIDVLTTRIFAVFFGDQAMPGGTAPTTASGVGALTLAPGAFSAQVVADGHLVGLSVSPAYTLAAEKDSYFDLASDGTWTRTAVNNLATAPSVAALSQRVYMIRTDLTDRTLVTDFRNTYARVNKVFDVDRVRLGEYLRDSAASRALARVFARWKTAGTGYTLLLETTNDDGDLIGNRIYVRHATGGMVVVRGAAYVPLTVWPLVDVDLGGEWVRDDGATTATMESLGSSTKSSYSVNFTTVASPFADTLWFDNETAINGLVKRQDHIGGVRAGTDMNGSDYERSSVFRFLARVFGGGQREAVLEAGWLKQYALPDAQGTGGVGRGGEWASNCTWNSATSQWDRITASIDCYKLELSSTGLRLLRHASADADSWADTIAAGTWQLVIDTDSGSLVAGVDMLSNGNILALGTVGGAGFVPSSNPVGTPEQHQLYAANVPKAWGRIAVTTTILSQTGFNYTATINGSSLRITLARPATNPNNLCAIASADGGYICSTPVVSASVFDIQLRTDAGVIEPIASGAPYVINFQVFCHQ